MSCVVFNAFHWQYHSCRYKVHYVGYSSKHDEWKCESDLVPISGEEEESETVAIHRPDSYLYPSYIVVAVYIVF